MHIEIAGEPGQANTAFDDLDNLHPNLRRELLQLLYERLSETTSDVGDSGTSPAGMWKRATRQTSSPGHREERAADNFVFLYRPLTASEESDGGPGYQLLRVLSNDDFASHYQAPLT